MNYPQCALSFPNSISPTHILILAKSSNHGQQLSMGKEVLKAARWGVSRNSEWLESGEEELQGGALTHEVTEQPLCSPSGHLPASLPRHQQVYLPITRLFTSWKMLHIVNPEECHEQEIDFKVIIQVALQHLILRTQNIIKVSFFLKGADINRQALSLRILVPHLQLLPTFITKSCPSPCHSSNSVNSQWSKGEGSKPPLRQE